LRPVLTGRNAHKSSRLTRRDVLNDAFETFDVLNAPFRTSQQPDTFAVPLK